MHGTINITKGYYYCCSTDSLAGIVTGLQAKSDELWFEFR